MNEKKRLVKGGKMKDSKFIWAVIWMIVVGIAVITVWSMVSNYKVNRETQALVNSDLADSIRNWAEDSLTISTLNIGAEDRYYEGDIDVYIGTKSKLLIENGAKSDTEYIDSGVVVKIIKERR